MIKEFFKKAVDEVKARPFMVGAVASVLAVVLMDPLAGLVAAIGMVCVHLDKRDHPDK